MFSSPYLVLKAFLKCLVILVSIKKWSTKILIRVLHIEALFNVSLLQEANGTSLSPSSKARILTFKGRRKWMSHLKQDSKVVLPLLFCSIRPSRDQCPFTQMRKIFTQSADSNANLCRNTLTDKPRKNVLQAMWAIFNPVKLTRKISHYRIWGFKRL